MIDFIKHKTKLQTYQINNTIHLLNDDCTIPFIARYRKDNTGNLDELALFDIQKYKNEYEELQKRKQYIINQIKEKGQLTEELTIKIENTLDKQELEDLYLPFKPNKRSKASVAREKGLEPLAKILIKQNNSTDTNFIINKNKPNNCTFEEAKEGAIDIICDWLKNNAYVRNALRRYFYHNAIIKSKNVEDDDNQYKIYHKFSIELKRIKSHQLLAIIRGTNEKKIAYTIQVDKQKCIEIISEKWHYTSNDITEKAIEQTYSNYLLPAIKNDVLKTAKDKAEDEAITVFGKNLEQLLMMPPLGTKNVLAIDPGFKSGCKIVCISGTGALMHNETIYPHAPQNKQKEAQKKLSSLVNSHKIEAIAVGNGTASRETEHLIQSIRFDRKIPVYSVNEDGASVYSASKAARSEFPQYDVTVRGAISIGRRLQDPLAELIKIGPKSIGIGQYQHDVNEKKLKEQVDFVAKSCVNKVGINIYTGSKELLSHISGISSNIADEIINYRQENIFNSKQDLLKIKGLGQKAFTQAAGFIRISNTTNPLDNSAIHPENYDIVNKIAAENNVKINDLINNEKLLNQINPEKYITEKTGMHGIKDIIDELKKPNRDPRDFINYVEFDKAIKQIKDLKTGMILNGIVTNITNFGAFIDIGIKENGLLHISNIAHEFVDDPTLYLKINQPLRVKVLDIDIEKKRINLSLKDVEN